jgi:hypothetical protein
MTATEQTTDDDIVHQALHGPWQAVLAWRDGWVATWGDFDGNCSEPGDVRILIVRGTAAPVDLLGDGMPRMPGTYNGADLLVEWDGEEFDDVPALEARWLQAQVMVAGLNAAGTQAQLDDAAEG